MIRRLVLCGALLIIATTGVFADGILIPGPPERPEPEAPYFTIKYHHVDVKIRDQVATTTIDQVFINESRRELEATYLFPLPPGSVVRDFAVEADGRKMTTELLDADEAQATYEEIMRRRKDPALFQYAGNNTYRARIYPIPADGERRIQITYSELLTHDAGVVEYVYPLSTEQFSTEPVGETVVNCSITSRDPIASVYCPSHDVSIGREGRRDAKVSYEENNTRPDRDLRLYYTVSQDDVGTHLLTYKERGEDGFFMLLAAPSVDVESDVLPKNIVFVLDRSGSMSGEKIEQARDALTFCVNQLNDEDTFEIITFSDNIRSFGDELQKADLDTVREARTFIKDMEAAGSTDIDSAMELAMKRRTDGRPNYIVMLTDGLPTAGETDLDTILTNVEEHRGEMDEASTRVFVFGVGYDVDTHFLDKMAVNNGGVASYVRPEESIEAKVSSFYSKISRPMLTDIDVDFGRITTFDMFPKELPDLFYGSQIVALGRYEDRTTGEATVALSGQTPDGSQTFEVEAAFPDRATSREYIPPLWAARKVGWLLDEIRLHGEEKELVDEIVRLGTEYGILTEYTSFLATEGGEITEAEVGERLMGPAGALGPGGVLAEPMGAHAVSQRDNAQTMQQAANVAAQNMYQDAEGNWQRVGNIRNVGQRGFIQQGEQWVDSRLRLGEEDELEPDLRVQAFSEAHFQLSRAFPALNSQLSVADNIRVLINGQIVEIGAEGKTSLTEDELQQLMAPTEAETGATPTPAPRIRTMMGDAGLIDGLSRMLAGVWADVQKYI